MRVASLVARVARQDPGRDRPRHAYGQLCPCIHRICRRCASSTFGHSASACQPQCAPNLRVRARRRLTLRMYFCYDPHGKAFGASMTLRALLFPDNTSACIASTIVLAAVWILTKFAAEHLATVAPDAPGAGAVESMALAERVLVGAVSLSEVLALVCVLAGAAGVAAHIWMQQPSGASRVFRGGVAALCLGVVSSVAGLLLFRLPAGQLGVRAGRAVDVTAATTMAETIEPAELLVRHLHHHCERNTRRRRRLCVCFCGGEHVFEVDPCFAAGHQLMQGLLSV